MINSCIRGAFKKYDVDLALFAGARRARRRLKQVQTRHPTQQQFGGSVEQHRHVLLFQTKIHSSNSLPTDFDRFDSHSGFLHLQAISCLKRALWLSPVNWRVLHNLGIVHLSTLQPASAFNFLCAAVNLRSDIGSSFLALGCELDDRSETKRAVRIVIVGALHELDDVENGLRAFRQASSLSEDDPIVAINTSVLLFKNNLVDEGLRYLEKFRGLVEAEDGIDAKVNRHK